LRHLLILSIKVGWDVHTDGIQCALRVLLITEFKKPIVITGRIAQSANCWY